MNRRSFAFTVVGALLLAGCQTTGTSNNTLAAATLPADLSVSDGSGLPDGLSRFVGIWDGTWGTALDGKVAVTSVGADGAADVYYAWGDHPAGRFKSGGFATNGTIKGGVLTLTRFRNGADVNYTFQDDGSLLGNYVIDGETSIGRFNRRPGT